MSKVNNYLISLPKTLPHGFKLDIKKAANGGYTLKVINKNGRQAARLRFSLDRDILHIIEGETERNYRGRQIGTFLRAIATKAGYINGSRKGTHFGKFTSNTAYRLGVPNSTRILKRLGWKVINKFDYGHMSEFNYKTTNMKAVNNAIRNSILPGAVVSVR